MILKFVIKKQILEPNFIRNVLWYDVEENQGEDQNDGEWEDEGMSPSLKGILDRLNLVLLNMKSNSWSRAQYEGPWLLLIFRWSVLSQFLLSSVYITINEQEFTILNFTGRHSGQIELGVIEYEV